MWNTISLVQDLNSCRRVHFLRRYPLHHGHLQSLLSNDGNKGVLNIPQSSWFTSASPSDCLVSYHQECFYLSVELQWVYFTGPVGWDCRMHRLLLCRGVRPRPTTSVLVMTVNILMVRFQQCWSFGECGAPLHCHRSQIHSGLNRTKPCFFHYTDFCI